MTTPPERSSKLAPRWKGPFFVKRVPNAYQVTYEYDLVWRTVHVNHVKPARIPADGFLFLYLHLNHPCLLQDISRGVSSGLNPGHQFLLNQPPLPQSPPSQPPHHAPPRLPRVGPPHAHQPIRIRLPALSHGHQPLLGELMTIHGWVNHCGALHASTLRLAL